MNRPDSILLDGWRYYPEPGPLDRNELARELIKASQDICGSPLEEVAPISALLHRAAVMASIDPTNHHSAEACPYCNPEGKKLQ